MFDAFRNILKTGRSAVIDEVHTADYIHLSIIHKASFPRGWSDGEFDALLSQKAYSGLAARIPGTQAAVPIGFILIKQVEDEAEVITIAVDPAARGRGIADQLMREAIRRQQADRVEAIFLEVDETNSAAVGLYKRLGFKVMDHRAGYYSSASHAESKPPDALVMRLDLG